MVQTVVLVANGEIKVGRVADATAAGLAKALRKTRQPTVVGTYTWEEQVLTLWGWAEGRAGTENKHELPPPHDKSLWFGDIIVTAAAAGSSSDISVAEWKEFYEAAFKGFEDLGSEDSEDEEGEGEEEEEDAELEEVADADADGDDDESAAGSDSASEAEAEEEGEGDGDGEAEGEEDDVEEADDDECYDSDGGGGSGKRRAPRRRAMAAPEYRRMDMGLRSKIKLPLQVGRRAPRWQTAAQLEPEP